MPEASQLGYEKLPIRSGEVIADIPAMQSV